MDNITDEQFLEIVKDLKLIDVDDTFSKKWFNNHKNVIITNMYLHGHLELLDCTGAQQIDNLVIHKFEILLRELITTYFVRFIKFEENAKNKNNVLTTSQEGEGTNDTNNITSYLLLYHETAILNILEIIMLNDSIYEHVDNYLIDLFAYLYSNLVSFFKTESNDYFVKPMSELSIDEMLKEENDKTYEIDKLKIYLNVLNVLRNITDRIHLLSNSVINKIVDYDILLILIPLMEKAPWRHENYIFIENEWRKCDQDEMAHVEQQLWIIFYSLLMNRICQEKYEMTNYRRENILKLRKYMNERLYQYIPPIKTLHTFIEHLYISKSVFPQCKNSYMLIDVVPQIYEEIKTDILKNKKKILAILNKVVIDKESLGNISDIYFSIYEFDEQYKKKEKLNETKKEKTVDMSEYKHADISEEIEEEYRCNFCNEMAELQCSQCKNTYYCSKECQMNDWYKHREECVTK